MRLPLTNGQKNHHSTDQWSSCRSHRKESQWHSRPSQKRSPRKLTSVALSSRKYRQFLMIYHDLAIALLWTNIDVGNPPFVKHVQACSYKNPGFSTSFCRFTLGFILMAILICWAIVGYRSLLLRMWIPAIVGQQQR